MFPIFIGLFSMLRKIEIVGLASGCLFGVGTEKSIEPDGVIETSGAFAFTGRTVVRVDRIVMGVGLFSSS